MQHVLVSNSLWRPESYYKEEIFAYLLFCYEYKRKGAYYRFFIVSVWVFYYIGLTEEHVPYYLPIKVHVLLSI